MALSTIWWMALNLQLHLNFLAGPGIGMKSAGEMRGRVNVTDVTCRIPDDLLRHIPLYLRYT